MGSREPAAPCSFCRSSENTSSFGAHIHICHGCFIAQLRLIFGAAVGVFIYLVLFDQVSPNGLLISAVIGAWVEIGTTAAIRGTLRLRGRSGSGHKVVGRRARLIGALIVIVAVGTAVGICFAYPEHFRWR